MLKTRIHLRIRVKPQFSYLFGIGVYHIQTTALANLTTALKPFQDLARDTLVTVSVSLVQVFLMIAAKPGQTNSELAKAFDMPHGDGISHPI
jgi:hypothetical protein